MIGAVVVTYNSARTLRRCIQSLWGAGVQEIVVVDNNSSDHSVATAHALGVRVLARQENDGFAAGCNVGAALLPYYSLLFVNPDAWVAPTALARAQQALRGQVGIVGLGLCSPAGGEEPRSFGQDVTLLELVRRRSDNDEVRVDWVSGGAMLVRGDVFTAVGGFDERYFMYWEDVDLCRRVRALGYDVVRDALAVVWHERGASLRDSSAKTALYDESADRYFRKHYATPIWLIQRYLRKIHRLRSPRVQ